MAQTITQNQSAPIPVNTSVPTTLEPKRLKLSVEGVTRIPFEVEYRNEQDELVSGTFHLNAASDLTLEQQILLGQNGALMSRLGDDKSFLSPEEVSKLAGTIRQAGRDLCYDVPEAVLDQLSDHHYMSLIGAFGEASTQ